MKCKRKGSHVQEPCSTNIKKAPSVKWNCHEISTILKGPQPRKLPCSTHMKRPPCAKGAVAKRLRDCYSIILQDHQIGSMFIQSPRRHRCAWPPPPFAQGGLMKEVEACGVLPPFAGGRLGLGSIVGLLVLEVAWRTSGVCRKASTHMKRPPCAKGAVAKRLRDCYTIILRDHQIGSMCRQSLRHGCAVPPPFTQGGLMKEMEACGVLPPFAGGGL